MTQQYSEGDIADGPGGVTLVYRGGRWVPQGTIGGPVVLGKPNAKSRFETPKLTAEVSNATTNAAVNAATQADQIRQARASADRAASEATIAAGKADEAKANSALSTMAPTSELHGEAYLQKYVPVGQRAMVRAYANGDLGSRAGGMSTSMLPIIQHAMNYDPTVSATTFPARAKMQQDLAGGDPKTLGGGLRAMEQMIFHARDVMHDGAALDNYGPGPIGHVGNVLRVMGKKVADDPALAAYNQAVINYAPESQKGVAGAAGIGAERGERHDAYSPTLSQASRVAALQQDATMAFQRTGALNDQYKRLLGKDIVDLLPADARKAYDEVMAGGYGKDGQPLHLAAGYTPGAAIGGIPGSGGGGGGNGPAPVLSGASAMRTEADPERGAQVEAAIRSFMSPDEIARRFPGTDISNIAGIQAGLRRNPDYKFGVDSTREVPQTDLNRLVSNPVAVGAMSAADAIVPFGLYGTDARDAVTKAKEAAPGAALVGTLIGGVPAAMGGEALAGRLLGAGSAWAPRVADAAYGALQGYGNADEGGGVSGAVIGGVGGLAGGAVGRQAVRGAGAALRGVTGSSAASYLRGQGVPLTVGQFVGGAAKDAEDKMTGYLGIGGIIRARRNEGLDGFNQAAFRQGSLGDPLVTNIGERGAEQMDQAVTRAYAPLDNASVTLDAQLNRDLGTVRQNAHAIPGRGADYDYLANRYLDPNLPGVGVTVPANNLQEASRLMRAGGAGQGAGVNFPGPFRDATNQAANAIDGAIIRSSPEAALSLAQGNAVYRNAGILDEAVKAGRATRGADGDAMFMPSQLANASVSNANKYGGRSFAATTDRPFFDLTTAGQEVLPSKTADSGTAGRLAMGALVTGLAGGGAGLGALDGGSEGAAEGGGAGLGALATLGTLAALGGSRAGQRAIISSLADRPNALRHIGQQVYDRSAIGGPLAIPGIRAAYQYLASGS